MKKKKKSFCRTSFFFSIGSGAYPHGAARGRGGGRSESLLCLQYCPVFGKWDPSAENWGRDLCLKYGTRIRDWVPLSLRLLLEMGGVCYEPGRPNRGVRCDGPGLVTTRSCWARRWPTEQRPTAAWFGAELLPVTFAWTIFAVPESRIQIASAAAWAQSSGRVGLRHLASISELKDYWKYEWVLPVYRYEGLGPLLATLAEKVIAPAEGKVTALQDRRRMIEVELTKPQ